MQTIVLACLFATVQAYALLGVAPRSSVTVGPSAAGARRVASTPVANIMDNEPPAAGKAKPQVGPADAPKQRIQADQTYNIMFKTLLETEKKIPDEVSKNYALFDYGFMQRLEKLQAGVAPGSADATRLAEVATALQNEMGRRMSEAAVTLRNVLQSPSAIVMEGKMAGLARQGKIDDAVLQLIEANLQQARAAGEAGAGAVRALGQLQSRMQDELDKVVSPDAQLLRRLLRMDSKPARLQLLKEKMSPKQKSSLLMASSVEDATKTDLKEEDTAAEVDPRMLAQAFTNLKVRSLSATQISTQHANNSLSHTASS